MQLPLPVPPGSRPLPDACCGLQGARASAPTPHNWATWHFAHAKTTHGIRMVDVQAKIYVQGYDLNTQGQNDSETMVFEV